MSSWSGKSILVTGGTGSFGHELMMYLRGHDIREIRIFSRDELKQEQMRLELQDDRIKFYIGDVRDFHSIDKATRGTNFVFHAAALKQVPSCEFFPMQAVQTNIIGSQNVLDAAIANGVERVVMLSTDKAVYPVNAMGMTKALMEKTMLAAARSVPGPDTVLTAVRYGNVLCSRGSVIPLFIKQIKNRAPITITVPTMTRFLLPLPYATELVDFAFQNAEQGDLFIRKAPACTVETLAAALQSIFRSQVPFNVIGMRHGEKLFETLATREELAVATDTGDYYRIPMDDRDLNYGKYFTEGNRKEAALADYTSHSTHQLGTEQVQHLLLSLPEVRRELDGWVEAAE